MAKKIGIDVRMKMGVKMGVKMGMKISTNIGMNMGMNTGTFRPPWERSLTAMFFNETATLSATAPADPATGPQMSVLLCWPPYNSSPCR